jgi:regulator of cell morphogenesis and NO signaling
MDSATPVGQLAAEHPTTVRVLQKLGIDFCCGGSRSLGEACAAKGVDLADVLARLEEAAQTPTTDDVAGHERDPRELIKHILGTHHEFTREELSRLQPLLDKVVKVHGMRHPELLKLPALFAALREDLLPHMLKEEQVLFPYVERLAEGNAPAPFFGTVRNPIGMMAMEHEQVGELLREMRRVTDGYTLPEGACGSFRALYDGLRLLEEDLHRHIHLENNVLFPRALNLEEGNRVSA